MLSIACLLAITAGTPAPGTDPWIGTWELNVPKSRFSPGPPLRRETRTYERTGDLETSLIKRVNAEGKDEVVRAAYKLDGKYYPITGSPTLDDQAITRKDAFGITGSLRKAGTVIQRSSRTVSPDGKVMTITFKGTNPEGQAVHNVLVFDRR